LAERLVIAALHLNNYRRKDSAPITKPHLAVRYTHHHDMKIEMDT
jgi:hypothetical protein